MEVSIGKKLIPSGEFSGRYIFFNFTQSQTKVLSNLHENPINYHPQKDGLSAVFEMTACYKFNGIGPFLRWFI